MTAARQKKGIFALYRAKAGQQLLLHFRAVFTSCSDELTARASGDDRC
jgi:hypothetical protein